VNTWNHQQSCYILDSDSTALKWSDQIILYRKSVNFILSCYAWMYSKNKFRLLFLDEYRLNTVYISHFRKPKLGVFCFSFTPKIKRMTKIITWASILKTVSSIFPWRLRVSTCYWTRFTHSLIETRRIHFSPLTYYIIFYSSSPFCRIRLLTFKIPTHWILINKMFSSIGCWSVSVGLSFTLSNTLVGRGLVKIRPLNR